MIKSLKPHYLIIAAVLTFGRFSLNGSAAEPRNISNDTPAEKISFGNTASNIEYATAKQYLYIAYPADNIQRDIRLYTNNENWQGGGTDRSGLISASALSRIPLYWTDFAAKTEKVVFSSQTESSWRRIIDISNPDFEERINETLLSQNQTGASIVYLAAKIPSNLPSKEKEYKTKLVIEVVNKIADVSAPKIVHVPHKAIALGKKNIVLSATISEDVQLKSAILHYRFNGELSFSTIPLTLNTNPENPFQWIGSAVLPHEIIKTGKMQYYFEASDGLSKSFAGSESSPFESDIIAEFEGVETDVSLSGGKVTIFEGDSRYGSSELTIPAGTLEKNVKIIARKLDPRVQKPYQGQSPLIVCEFHPEEPIRFLTPIQLSLSYEDEDGDGMVDGTNILVKDLGIFWWDNFEWRYVGGKVRPSQRTVTTPLTHLSIFALFPAAGNAGNYRPKEKIITPALQDGINDFANFDGLDGSGENFTIEIFDVTGKKIRTLNQFGQWDGRDDNGNIAESGVYIYQVHVQNKVLSGTITVAK